jgi:hypothetical protein
MTVKSASSSPLTVKDQLNYPLINTVADALGGLAFGDLLLGQTIQFRRAIDFTAAAQANDGYNVATLSPIVMRSSNLPPAAAILRATVRAGGVTGELTVDAYGTTPATGHIAVAPNGSIVTLTTDAITNVDLVYVPERGLVVEFTLPVVSGTGVLTIPTSVLSGAGGNGVVLLLEAEALSATVTGKKVVLVPGTAPATTQARLNVAKTQVLFNAGTDVVTRARVKLFVAMPAGDGLIATLAASAISPP